MRFTLVPFAFFSLISAQDGLVVHTLQGDVTGTLVSSGVRQFLGIPYAVANRWEAPQPPPSRNATFKTTSFGDSCVQNFSPNNLQFLKLAGFSNDTIFVSESEDCLSINIWAPSIGRKQATAVMIWIYGGGFQFGTSNFPVYNGRNMVKDNDDILVVSFNYRTNIFGQPNAPQLSKPGQSQNFGLLDVFAAVKWVHDNIAQFGGNPDRIILFGESAGSAAADAYTYAHPQDTIVKGVIQQSGILSDVKGNTTVDPSGWDTIANAAGCGTDSTDAQLSCMKAVSFRALEDTVIRTNIVLQPIPDNITLFSDNTARSAAGNFLHVPFLIGTNANEADIFVVGLEEAALGSTVPTITGILSDVITQAEFTCPASRAASDRVKAGVSTWRYQYQAVFPGISSRPDLRAYHSSEIPIIFGTFGMYGTPSTIETAFSAYVQKAWVAFARDPTHGLSNYGWPNYKPDTDSLVQLGNADNNTGATFAKVQLTDLSCLALDALNNLIQQLTDILEGAAKRT